MDSFEDVIQKTIVSLSVLTLGRLKDGSFSVQDCLDTIDNLHSIEDGLRTHIAQIEAACEDAGGADSKGDLDKALRINYDLEDLDISGVKPGWGKKGV